MVYRRLIEDRLKAKKCFMAEPVAPLPAWCQRRSRILNCISVGGPM